MNALDKLNALGHSHANRILATEVMGWKWRFNTKPPHSDNCMYILPDGSGVFEPSWNPCEDLNHAKMVVDKLTEKQKSLWADQVFSLPLVYPADRYNSPADARMCAVMEALQLWPEELK